MIDSRSYEEISWGKDYTSLSTEERINVFDRCKYVYKNELHEDSKDISPFNYNRPIFLCNTGLIPMMFSIAWASDKVCIHVEHEFIDNKWITLKYIKQRYIPVEKFVELVKNITFVPIYIPENCPYPFFGTKQPFSLKGCLFSILSKIGIREAK